MIEPNDDIINHIKSVMRNHEEPYDEGAWERFKTAQAPAPVKKGAIIMWKWAMAAAAAVIAVFLLARVYNSSDAIHNISPEVTSGVTIPGDSLPHITQATPEINTDQPDILANDNLNNTHIIAGNNGNTSALPNEQSAVSANSNPSAITGSNPVKVSKPVMVITAPPSLVVTTNTTVINPQPNAKEVDFWKNKVIVDAPTVIAQPVYKEAEKQLAVTRPTLTDKPRKEKNKKWQPSLYVSPLFGDLGIDMGYGVSVGYAINDKIKISSGIAHTKLSASRSYGAGPVGSLVASAPTDHLNGAAGPVGPTGAAGTAGRLNSLDSKAAITSAYNFAVGQQTNALQQVDGSLSGIDIPVEINYNFSKKLYASAGVSGLVVINDNKKYTYVDNRNVKVSVETNKGNLKEDKSVLFSEQNTTTQPIQAPRENIPFLGFYNISVGYRQKISGRTGVALEPFLKVPMKNVTQENLKYMGTGIRLKFDL